MKMSSKSGSCTGQVLRFFDFYFFIFIILRIKLVKSLLMVELVRINLN